MHNFQDDDNMSVKSFESNTACMGDANQAEKKLNEPRVQKELDTRDLMDSDCQMQDESYDPSEDKIQNVTPKVKKTKAKRKTKVRHSRKIKDLEQLAVLEKFFELDPNWTTTTKKFISEFMELSELQLYKWGYDQKRKYKWKQGIRSEKRDIVSSTYNAFKEIGDYNKIVSQICQELEEAKIDIPNAVMVQFEQLKKNFLRSKQKKAEPVKKASRAQKQVKITKKTQETRKRSGSLKFGEEQKLDIKPASKPDLFHSQEYIIDEFDFSKEKDVISPEVKMGESPQTCPQKLEQIPEFMAFDLNMDELEREAMDMAELHRIPSFWKEASFSNQLFFQRKPSETPLESHSSSINACRAS